MIVERFSGKRKIIETDSVYLYSPDDDLILSFIFKERDFDVIVRQSYINGIDTQIMNLIVDGVCHYMEPLKRLPDGSLGTTQPVEMVTIGEKKLYIHIWSYLVSESVRKIEYTVYSSD